MSCDRVVMNVQKEPRLYADNALIAAPRGHAASMFTALILHLFHQSNLIRIRELIADDEQECAYERSWQ